MIHIYLLLGALSNRFPVFLHYHRACIENPAQVLNDKKKTIQNLLCSLW